MKTRFHTLKLVIYLLTALALLAGIYIQLSMDSFNIKKQTDYLYSITCRQYNYRTAEKLVEAAPIQGACSSVRFGNLMGRNFDWTYSEEADFIITVPADDDRYSSIGVASLAGIDNTTADKLRFSFLYYFLPFYTVDGINEKGLCVCVNEVPAGDAGLTTGTNPGADRLCSAIAVRYLLDYASSVDEALDILSSKDIYACKVDGEYYEVHLMLSDSKKTAIVEFIDNKMVVIEDDLIMTNFYLGLDHYTDHAEGVERYDILTEEYHDVTDKDSLFDLLSDVYYTGLYDLSKDPLWYSEIYGEYVNDAGEEFTYRSDPADFKDIFDKELDGYSDRQRDGHFWQTVHTSVYDLDELTLTVCPQEGDERFSFAVSAKTALERQREANSATKKILIPMDMICLIVLFIILYGIVFEIDIHDRKSKWFVVIVFCAIVAVISDIIAWVYDGLASRVAIQATANYFGTIMSGILAVPFLYYETEYISERKRISFLPAHILAVFNATAVIVLTVLTFNGTMFTFKDGVYFQGEYYFLVVGISLINVTVIIIAVLKNSRTLGLHDTISFLIYGFIPLVAVAYELVDPQLEFGFVAVTFSILFIYLLLQAGKNNDLKVRQEVLEELCFFDQLTGLSNRRAYDEFIDSKKHSPEIGVFFCDLNSLKYTNDTLGHKAGDNLLIEFSKLLKDVFHNGDIFRISGDEFVIFMNGDSASQFSALEKDFINRALEKDDIASIGSAYGSSEDIISLVSKAEYKMYQEKAEFYKRNPEQDRRVIHNNTVS